MYEKNIFKYRLQAALMHKEASTENRKIETIKRLKTASKINTISNALIIN